MVETSDQARPLAPASDRHVSSDDEAATTPISIRKNRRRRCLRCCGCVGAALLVQAAVVVILIFTVFKARDPVIRLNRVTVDRMELVNGTNTPRPGSNMSLTADVSVKNPNYVGFRYPNTTTALFYRGAEIGVARGPPGNSRARRTARMNVTIEVVADRVLALPDVGSDLNSGAVTISSYSDLKGKVKIWMIKKEARVKMNCTLTINMTSQSITQQKCKRKVKL